MRNVIRHIRTTLADPEDRFARGFAESDPDKPPRPLDCLLLFVHNVDSSVKTTHHPEIVLYYHQQPSTR